MNQSVDRERFARYDRLLDLHEIEDCIKRVSRGIDRFDRDLFLSAYHPEAVIDAGAFVGDPATVYEGGAALHEEGQSATIHHLTNHRCDLDGDTAHAETYFLYVGRNRDDTNWAAGGRYIDRLERRAGEWRIAFRQTIIEWSGKIADAGVPLFADVPDLAFNGHSARSREDPSYRRPHVNRRTVTMPDNPRDLGRT